MNPSFLFFLLFATSQLSAQLLAPCPITDSLYNKLDAQAAQIMLNEMLSSQTASDRPVELDSQRRAEYLSLLFAVHELENSPERDLVIDQLKIKPFKRISTRIIQLYADPALDWMANIRSGNPTGNQVLDSLVNHYNLEISNYSDQLILNSHRVDLTSAGHLNTRALAKVFLSAMDSLNFSQAQLFFGDGNDIKMIPLLPSGWRVQYSVGSGDCPSGCTMRELYNFDPVVLCTEFDIQDSGSNSTQLAAISPLRVYPTPFTEEIHLSETIVRYRYEIFDAMGRRVKQSATGQSGPVSGLGDLVSGWYVLKVRDQAGKIYVGRVVK